MPDPGPHRVAKPAETRAHFMNVRGLQAMFDTFANGFRRSSGEPSSRFVQWLEVRDRYETLTHAGAFPDSIREITDG